MPVINGVYLKDFAALPSAVVDANIIPIAITGDQVAYRTTVGGIVTDARVTSKLLTGLSVTGGAVVATDTILQAFGKVQNQINSKVSSVGLTMPSAFNVANSPITSSGTLAVTAAGVASQYIRGDGALADFPTNGGGGSSVSYYLNGSVSQGTFVGNTYYEMNKTPVIGTGTDFTIGADGYIAQFITDANDPASLLIPAGNWNVEMYFSASSSGGTPSFYVEVYKYNGTTFTLLGTSSATPEGITNGTAIDIYYTSVGIPETVLTITDRLAIRVYVVASGRTITLHTEDNHLSEIITTFSNGINTLNGLTKQAQYFAVGSTGTDFAISSSVDTHTFNIPSASLNNRGLITTGSQDIGGEKSFKARLRIDVTSDICLYARGTGAGAHGVVGEATAGYGGWFLNTGTANEVLRVDSVSLTGALATFNNTNGTSASISNAGDIRGLSFIKTGGTSSQFLKADGTVDSTTYQGAITLTTTGTSGAATLVGSTLNVPNYADGGVLSLSAIGGTANANGATITGTVLNLQPADASFGGVVTTGTQTFAGAKTLTGALSGTSATFNNVLTLNKTDAFAALLIQPSTNTNAAGTRFLNTGNDMYMFIDNSAGDYGPTGATGPSFAYNANIRVVGNRALQIATNDTIRLTIASTGAATFSSSVTATGLTVSLSSGTIARFSSAIAALGTTSIGLGYTDGSGGHDMAQIFGQRINDGSGRSSLILAVNAVDNDQSATVSDAKITISGSTGNITLASALTGTSATFSGAVSKGSGSFRIEHPLPSLSETHQLVHSFIEGPQADLIYRGKLTLVNGKAQANIDKVSTMTEGTFEALCRDIQCFTTNESGWDLIKGKVIGNIIYIESQNENSTDEISWMVIGERKDKHMMETEWTDENGKVIVEPLKPIEPEPMEDLTEVIEPIVEVTAQVDAESEPKTEPIEPDNNLE